jgi:hypothetical protein
VRGNSRFRVISTLQSCPLGVLLQRESDSRR